MKFFERAGRVAVAVLMNVAGWFPLYAFNTLVTSQSVAEHQFLSVVLEVFLFIVGTASLVCSCIVAYERVGE